MTGPGEPDKEYSPYPSYGVNKIAAGSIMADQINIKARAPIPSTLDGLHQNITLVEDAFNQLVERIAPALGPSYPTPSDDLVQGDRAEASEVTERLVSMINRLDNLRQQINVVRGRVEL